MLGNFQRAKVLKSYIANRPDELDLKEGDEIDVIECIDPRWFIGCVAGSSIRYGLVPKAICLFEKFETSYPELIQHQHQQQQQQQQHHHHHQNLLQQCDLFGGDENRSISQSICETIKSLIHQSLDEDSNEDSDEVAFTESSDNESLDGNDETESCSLPWKTINISSENSQNFKGNSTISIKDISALAGNEICADCGCKDAIWASINLGITLCVQCSGVHRGLGVHISKVKSLFLDNWSVYTINMMHAMGNIRVNEIIHWTSREPLGQAGEINDFSDRKERESFIRKKYCPDPSNFKSCDLSLGDIEKKIRSSITADTLSETFRWTRAYCMCSDGKDWRLLSIDGHGSLLYFAASLERVNHIEWFRHVGLTEEFLFDNGIYCAESIMEVAQRLELNDLIDLIHDFKNRVNKKGSSDREFRKNDQHVSTLLYPSPFEGFVNKSAPSLKKNSFKSRYFVLDEYRLAYYKSAQASEPIKTVDAIDIVGFRRRDDGPEEAGKFYFEICTRFRNFLCWVDQATVREYWGKAIDWIQKRCFWKDFFKTNFAFNIGNNCYLSHGKVAFVSSGSSDDPINQEQVIALLYVREKSIVLFKDEQLRGWKYLNQFSFKVPLQETSTTKMPNLVAVTEKGAIVLDKGLLLFLDQENPLVVANIPLHGHVCNGNVYDWKRGLECGRVLVENSDPCNNHPKALNILSDSEKIIINKSMVKNYDVEETAQVDVIFHLDNFASSALSKSNKQQQQQQQRQQQEPSGFSSPLSGDCASFVQTRVFKVIYDKERTDASDLIDRLLMQHFETAVIPRTLEPYFRLLLERPNGHYYLLSLDQNIFDILGKDGNEGGGGILHCKLWKSGISRFELAPTSRRLEQTKIYHQHHAQQSSNSSDQRHQPQLQQKQHQDSLDIIKSINNIKLKESKDNKLDDEFDRNSVYRRRIPEPRLIPTDARPPSHFIDFAMEGWLHKEGFRHKSWKKRYFTFSPSTLEIRYYKDSFKTKFIGSWSLVHTSRLDIKIPCHIGRKVPSKYCFCIGVKEKIDGDNGDDEMGSLKERVLCCDDEKTLHVWLEKITLCLNL